VNWIKCNEKMPEEEALVIAWFSGGSYPVWAFFDGYDWIALLGIYHVIFKTYEITHWMFCNPPME
jgi:Protein of unknown function (DUF551)